MDFLFCDIVLCVIVKGNAVGILYTGLAQTDTVSVCASSVYRPTVIQFCNKVLQMCTYLMSS